MKMKTAKLIGCDNEVKEFYNMRPSLTRVKTSTKLSFELGISYVANEKTVTEVNYKIYCRRVGSKDLYVLGNENDKNKTIKLKRNITSIEEGFEEKFGGSEIRRAICKDYLDSSRGTGSKKV